MSDLIPTMTITEFRQLKVSQLRRMKSCEIFADGEYLFTFVNGNTETSGFLRTQTEYSCCNANGVGGEMPEVVLKREVVPA